MTILFELLGALLGIYTVWAVFEGEVYAKAGPGGRKVSRDDTPRHFWLAIAVYAGLSLALLTVF